MRCKAPEVRRKAPEVLLTPLEVRRFSRSVKVVDCVQPRSVESLGVLQCCKQLNYYDETILWSW